MANLQFRDVVKKYAPTDQALGVPGGEVGGIPVPSAEDFATAEQGAKADTAVQPDDLGTAATMSPVEVVTDPDAQAALSGAFALLVYGTAPPRSGAWATPAGVASTGNYVSGDCRAGVLPIPASCTLDRITCEVTTAAENGLFRLGIWADDGTGRPGALILDAGTVDASTTGIKEITISQALTPGRYWIGGAAQGATLGMRITSPSSVHLSRTLDRPDTVAGVLQAAETAARTLGVTGALPDPFNPGSSQASHPRVAVRFA